MHEVGSLEEGTNLMNLSAWGTGRGVRVYVSKSSAASNTRRTPVPFTGEWSYANQLAKMGSSDRKPVLWRLAEAAGLESEHAYGLWTLQVCIVIFQFISLHDVSCFDLLIIVKYSTMYLLIDFL